MEPIGRRAALKLLTMAGGAAAIHWREARAQPASAAPGDEVLWLGRVEWEQPVYRSLGDRRGSNVTRVLAYHQIVPIHGVVRDEPTAISPHNDVWFETEGGYVHSSFVVPCHETLNEPEDTIGGGFWGEITVPLTHQRWAPSSGSRAHNPLRYATVYRVIDRRDDASGQAWYRLQDDVYPHQDWWVEAAMVRRVRPEELAPISAAVPSEAKRIEVDISTQTLVCFEHDVVVFATRISSGGIYYDGATQIPFPTPGGEHFVQRKTPSRHMIGGEEINDPYDLPGVPWCTYFAATGEAIHGATTHNDFGHARSHGCINVAPDAAKWIYRWTTPSVAYDDPVYWLAAEDRGLATAVRVHRSAAGS